MQRDSTNTSFDNPAPFDNVDAANFWVFIDDFEDSEAGAVLDGGVFEASVDPALGDAKPRVRILVIIHMHKPVERAEFQDMGQIIPGIRKSESMAMVT